MICGGDFEYFERLQLKPFIEVLMMAAKVQGENKVAFQEYLRRKAKMEAESKRRK